MGSHWDNYAEKWKRVTSPLRPSTDDIDIYKTLIYNIAAKHDSLKVLLLGTTTEIIELSWPNGADLHVIEKSPSMVKTLWNPLCPHKCVLGDWFYMPVKSNSIDVVIGDGCYTTLGEPALYYCLNKEIRRVLKEDGNLFIRFFISPEDKENISQVLKTADDNFHAFKWRLAMALQTSFEAGIVLMDIWNEWISLSKKNIELQSKWDKHSVDTIHIYKNIKAKYSFPTMQELNPIMNKRFLEISINQGSYSLSERCPIIHYKVKPTRQP